MYLYVCGYTDIPFHYSPKFSSICCFWKIFHIETKGENSEKVLFSLYLSFSTMFFSKTEVETTPSSFLFV